MDEKATPAEMPGHSHSHFTFKQATSEATTKMSSETDSPVNYEAEEAMETDGAPAPAPTDSIAANRVMLYLLTLCSTLGGFLFGYDTGVISGALVLLKDPKVFNLTDIESESVVSAAVFGAIVGAALSSYGNAKFGRKPVIIASSMLFTVGSLLLGAAQSFAVLLVGRLIVGLGIGISSMTVPLYIAEASPPDIRGRLVSINTAFVTGGQFFACVLDAVLANVSNGWRYMLGLAAIPAVLQLLGFLLLPESPRYLIGKEQKKAAWAALVRIRGTEDVETEFNHIDADIRKYESENAGVSMWQELFRVAPVRRALILGCALQALQQFCGINTVMYYGATIIQMAGFNDPSTAIWLSAVVAFSNFIFTFVGIYLVERAGRRRLTLSSIALVFVMLTALGASFLVAQKNSTPVVGTGSCAFSNCFDCVSRGQCGFCQGSSLSLDPMLNQPQCLPISAVAKASTSAVCSSSNWHASNCPSDSRAAGWMILVSLFVYLAVFACGMGCMPWTINAEIYPLHVRSYALSIATSVNWVSNLIVSFTFLSIINGMGPAGAFWFYGVIAALGFVYLYKALPETRGLELEEIQHVFERKDKYNSIERA